jgi:hypothetical protein
MNQESVAWPSDSDVGEARTDRINIEFETFDEDLTFQDLGVTYYQLPEELTGPWTGDVTVTFEAGVHYALPAERTLDFYTATAVAKGTAGNEVVFTSGCDPDQDPWVGYCSGGGVMQVGGSGQNSFEHTTFERLGWTYDGTYSDTSYPGFYLASESDTKLSHVRFVEPNHEAIIFQGMGGLTPDSGAISIESPLFAYSDDYIIKVGGACRGAYTLPADTQLPEFAYQGILLSCDVIEGVGTLQDLGATYRGYGFQIKAGAHLTVAPGVEVLSIANAYWTVESGGALTIAGTQAAPVSLGATTTSGWGGIIAKDSDVNITYATLDDAATSATPRAAIRAEVPISVKNTTLTNSAGWGLAHAAADTTDYATSNTFTNNASGSVTTF